MRRNKDSFKEAQLQIASVHNYYERMVLDEAFRHSGEHHSDRDFIADVACVALNRLPPRYVRHDVDMAFYLSPAEQAEMENRVKESVVYALQIVSLSRRKHEEE